MADENPEQQNPTENRCDGQQQVQPAESSAWVSQTSTYGVLGNQTYRLTIDKSGELRDVVLANFSARIEAEVALDDGIEVTRCYELSGRLYNGRVLPPTKVPIDRFAAMNWVATSWGFGPSLAAGYSVKDHLRAAIEAYSGPEVPRKTFYRHLGWRNTEEGWVYLHAGGAIGGTQFAVDLPELEHYRLPDAVEDLAQAVQLSLTFLELGDPRVTFPLWALVWRAVLCHWVPATFMPWLVGDTGTLKSTVAGLALSHFGGPFDNNNLPASWLDTENRLEQRMSFAKDTLLVVDDFCPEKNFGLAQELQKRASRIIRSIGNRQGRGRLRADLSARPTYVPRGIALSTAEQLPNLPASAMARIFPIPVEQGSIDKAKLTQLQGQAQRLPHAMRGFIEYCRANIERNIGLRGQFDALRAQLRIDGHSRLPEVVANLYLGLEAGVDFALASGAIEPRRAEDLLKEGQRIFLELAREHAKILGEERPSRIFLQAIQEELASGRAWFADRKSGEVVLGTYSPYNQKLGWADQDGIYLLFGPAYAFVSERMRFRGGIVVGERDLKAMLLKDGLLLRGEGGRLDVKRWCERISTRVTLLAPNTLDQQEGTGYVEAEGQG